MRLLSIGSAQDVLRAACGPDRCAGKSDPACSSELADSVRAEELLERVELLGLADDLEDDRIRADVDDAGLEDVRQREQLRPAIGRRSDRDQRELALDGLLAPELTHAEHVDKLVHLLLD